MQKPICLISQTNDPYLNLAIEDHIFNDMDPRQHILFLWRNSDCVIIGRNQNPWVECNVQKLKEDNVKLVRRHSGGGAVFQDLGNSIFTFMSPKAEYSKDKNFQIIINALNKFNIKAEQMGRNDILVDNKKVSGSAFKEKQDRAFHHGTLLIDVNLERLQNYLTPSKKKLEAKGHKSVRSRVANLTEFNPNINHGTLMDSIINEFFSTYNAQKNIETLNHNSLSEIPSIDYYYHKLKSESWIYGKTPQFTHHLENQFEWGNIDLHLDVHQGKIKEAKIFSDSLNAEMIQQLSEALTNIDYNQNSIQQSVSLLTNHFPNSLDQIEEFSNWLTKEVT